MPFLASLLTATALATAPSLLPQDTRTVTETLPDGSAVEREVIPDAEGNEVPHGSYTRTAPDGVVLEEGRFRDGLEHGKWTFRWPNDRLRARGNFLRGLPAKKWNFRRDDGSKEANGSFEDGRRSGPWTFFDTDGEEDPLHSGDYGFASVTYTPGEAGFAGGDPVVRHGGPLLDGVPHGTWTFRWPDGSLQTRGRFERGRRVGDWTFHHGNGLRDDTWFVTEPPRGSALAPFPWEEGPAVEEDVPAPPAQELSPLVDEGEEAALRRLVGDLANGLLRDERLKELVVVGRPAVPHLIDALAACDPATPRGRTTAMVYAQALQLLCRGRGCGWREGSDEATREVNARALARWHSFWRMLGQDELCWSLALALPADGETELDVAALTLPRLGDPGAARVVLGDDPALRSGLDDALAWLAAHQGPDGSWDALGFGDRCRTPGACTGGGHRRFGPGVTGLAVLAFVQGGHGPTAGPHATAVARGVGALLRIQDPITGHFGPRLSTDFVYNHAIATLAVCTALGEVELDRYDGLRPALQRAVDLIHDWRSAAGSGGWRYELPPQGESDTSVTGWMVHALAAARRCGLEVRDDAFEGALDWIEEATDDSGRIGYDAKGSLSARLPSTDQSHPRDAGEAMTALGVLVHREAADALGRRFDPKDLKKQARLLRQTLPLWGDSPATRDYYGWCWGTRAARALGGETWDAWGATIKPEILYNQESDGCARGSWSTEGAWCEPGGRVYATAMLAACLAEALRED